MVSQAMSKDPPPNQLADATSAAVVWYRGLKFRAIVAALLVAAWIAAGILFVMQRDGRGHLEERERTMLEEMGNGVVTRLAARISEVAALNRSLATATQMLPKDDATFRRELPRLIDFGGDAGVAGGGFWPEPGTFVPGMERHAFFWGRDKNNALEFVNGPNEVPSKYFNEEWYVPAQFQAGNTCYWSASYVDPHTFDPMVTCTTPIRDGQRFTGTTSIDMRLQGLAEFAREAAKHTGGYIFLVDRNNRFITFGDETMIRRTTTGPDGAPVVEFLTATELARAQPSFTQAAAALDGMNAAIVAAARRTDGTAVDAVAAKIREQTATGRDVIDAPMAELAAAVTTDPLQTQVSANGSTLFGTQELSEDPVFEEPSMLLLFHVPNAYWKLGVVKPTRAVVAVATTITRSLVVYLLATMLLGLVLAYFVFDRWLIAPIGRISTAVRGMAATVAQRRHHELGRHHVNSASSSEIGVLGRNINALAQEIARSEGKLAQANALLERRVQERTQELSGALERLKNSQMQLVQSEKMASLGQMVAGIAHEINTPLGYVKNNILLGKDMLMRFFELVDCADQLGTKRNDPAAAAMLIVEAVGCTERLRADGVVTDSLQLSVDSLYGVEQISALVDDLRNFSRLDEARVKEVDIHECIDGALNIARNQIKSKAEIVKDYGEVPAITCSPSHMNQVFINLLNNAAQAMDKPGTIRIATSHANGRLNVVVEDTGRGIPKEVITRIFEPFFTTKPVGQGTGLGLSITYQIIEKHGGTISVASEPGRGTRFLISLPLDAQNETHPARPVGHATA